MKYVKGLVIRILMAIALLVIPVNIFYFMFSKITLLSSLSFLYLLGYSFKVEGYVLFINNYNLEFVSACVATSAYYLLALLVLLTKDIKLKVRFYMFLSGCLLIFLMNILRIDILLYILLRFGGNWFDKSHIFFWHFVSSVYVAAVWIFLTYKFKVKPIPVYSDIKFLLEHSVFKKNMFSRKKLKKTRAR